MGVGCSRGAESTVRGMRWGGQRCGRGLAPGTASLEPEEPVSLAAVPRRQSGCVWRWGPPALGLPAGPCPADGATSLPQRPGPARHCQGAPHPAMPGPGAPGAVSSSCWLRVLAGAPGGVAGGPGETAAPPPWCLSRPAANTGNSIGAGSRAGRASPCTHTHTFINALRPLTCLHTSLAASDLEKGFCTSRVPPAPRCLSGAPWVQQALLPMPVSHRAQGSDKRGAWGSTPTSQGCI